MRPFLLLFAPLALAGSACAAWLALPYPDETEATRRWMASTRPPAQPMTDSVPVRHTSTQESEETSEASPLPDPFRLGDRAPTTRTRRQPARPLADPDDAVPPPLRAGEIGQDTPAAGLPPLPAPPMPPPEPVPALRLLGTLHRDQHWIAVAELDGRLQRLQVGDVLPAPLGEVLDVREEQIDIAHAGKRLTIRMAGASASSAAPSLRTGRSASTTAAATSSRARKRRLIRPGVPP